MTAGQTIRLYDFFKQHLKIADETKVKVFVEEKFDSEKGKYLQKTDFEKIEFKIDLMRQELKTQIAEVKSDLRAEINKLVIWIIGIIFTASMVFFALSKYVH